MHQRNGEGSFLKNCVERRHGLSDWRGATRCGCLQNRGNGSTNIRDWRALLKVASGSKRDALKVRHRRKFHELQCNVHCDERNFTITLIREIEAAPVSKHFRIVYRITNELKCDRIHDGGSHRWSSTLMDKFTTPTCGYAMLPEIVVKSSWQS